jgi:CheY-like chemotaxis protein
VLIVDDEPDTRALTQAVLERNGFDVISVSSGSEALAYLARDTPSLILLDLEMDDMNGWEVLTMLRRHPHFGSFKVVVVSGMQSTLPRWVGYMRKPFRVDALLEMLDAKAKPSNPSGTGKS